MLVLAPHAPDSLRASNFWVDQAAMAEGAGCVVEHINGPVSAVDDALRALARTRRERCTVVLIMPNEIQEDEFQGTDVASGPEAGNSVASRASSDEVSRLVTLLAASRRPVFVAGRGGLGARDRLLALAEDCGALLATSAVARGLFSGEAWNLDVSGGFATPAATSLISEADLLVVWGASLNRWTTSNGSLLGAVRR
jgi:thiamine pyrophosphate-dependent acetolactate synthase large subunit-like protein